MGEVGVMGEVDVINVMEPSPWLNGSTLSLNPDAE
jgi:hypothetical protein